MPGIFSISWVKTVEELDVSGLNTSRPSERLSVLPDSFSTRKLLDSSEGTVGVGAASCSGMKLKGSRHGSMSGGTIVSRTQLILVPDEDTGSLTVDIVKLVLRDVEEGTEITGNVVEGTGNPGDVDGGTDIAGDIVKLVLRDVEEGTEITGNTAEVTDVPGDVDEGTGMADDIVKLVLREVDEGSEMTVEGMDMLGDVDEGTEMTGTFLEGTDISGNVEEGTDMAGDIVKLVLRAVEEGTDMTGDVDEGTGRESSIEEGEDVTGDAETVEHKLDTPHFSFNA